MGVRLHCSDPGAVVADGGRPRHDAQSIPTPPRPPQASRCDSAHLHLRIHPRICDLVGGLSLRVCQVATVLYTIHSGFSEAAPLLHSTAHRAARTSSVQVPSAPRPPLHCAPTSLVSRAIANVCIAHVTNIVTMSHPYILSHSRGLYCKNDCLIDSRPLLRLSCSSSSQSDSSVDIGIPREAKIA